MKYWVGVTDNDWFRYLRSTPGLDEVNFWQPSGRAPFTSLPEGTPFLFKVKAPHHHIAGGGFFLKYETLPPRLAWDAFGQGNGAEDYAQMVARIERLRRETAPEIGCSILGAPFFWPEDEWIPVAEYFRPNIVTGKTFDTTSTEGDRLWRMVEERLVRHPIKSRLVAESDDPAVYGDPRLFRPRRGHGTFKAAVTNAYTRRCAITGESTLPVLEAAHIRPFSRQGLNNTYNGMLLRSDFHKLFDLGFITVTPQYRVLVSDRIKTQWFNGKAYYRLHGELLKSLPTSEGDRPRTDLLVWHNENIFEQGGSDAL